MTAPKTRAGLGLDEFVVHLCNDCMFWEDCERKFPVTECEMFVDNYAEYYDGDAWREWLNATLGFGIGIERRQYEG